MKCPRDGTPMTLWFEDPQTGRKIWKCKVCPYRKEENDETRQETKVPYD